jgi:hypothetical protein
MDRGSVGTGTGLNLNKYVDRWIKEVLDNYASRNWDGVFGDITSRWTPNSWAVVNPDGTFTTTLPCNPRTGKAYTKQEWETDLLGAIQRIKQFFDPRGLIYLANSGGNWWREYNGVTVPEVEEFADSVYMIQIENFVLDFDKAPLSFDDWKNQMAAVQDMLKNRLNTIEVRMIDPSNQSVSNYFYRDASYLLVKEFNFMIRHSSPLRPRPPLKSWWLDTDLGASQGDMFIVPGTEVRQRNFAKGKVLANPHDTSTYTIDLGGTYTNVQTGQLVSSITLAPKRGAILTLP